MFIFCTSSNLDKMACENINPPCLPNRASTDCYKYKCNFFTEQLLNLINVKVFPLCKKHSVKILQQVDINLKLSHDRVINQCIGGGTFSWKVMKIF